MPDFPPVPPLMPWEVERMQAHFGWPLQGGEDVKTIGGASR